MDRLFAAVQFLTIINVPVKEHKNLQQSLPFFPLVGLLVGVFLFILSSFIADYFSSAISAALCLTLWVTLTGALHLDGFADSFDALLGGLENKERSLKIMADPLLGTSACVALFVLLLLKYSLLFEIIDRGNLHLLVFILFFSRVIPLALFLTTPYVRSDGIASNWQVSGIKYSFLLSVFCSIVFLLSTLGLGLTAISVVAIFSVYWYWRKLWLRRIGGFTGDVAGALIEITEVLLLLLVVM